MRLRIIKFSLLLTILLSIISCARLIPDQEVAERQQKLDVGIPSADSVSVELSATNYISEDARAWWLEFDDPILHSLIEKSLARSIDLKIAMARIDESMATLRASRSDLYPVINLESRTGASTLNFSRDRLGFSPERTNTNEIDFRLAWQVDLFGQLRNIAAASKESLQSQAHQLRDAQRLLVSQVAQSYYQIISLRERLKLIAESRERRRKSVARIDQLLNKGYATLLDKTRADSQYYQVRATFEELQLSEISALNQLSVLIGVNPAELRQDLQRTGKFFVPKETLPLPTIDMLLTHRPDLRAAESDLRAAVYNVNSAKAALYPSLSLSMNLGRGVYPSSNNLGAFPALNSTIAGVLMNTVTPVINRGRLLAAIDANSSLLRQAHLVYENSVLQAVTQIDTALVTVDKNRIIYKQRVLASENAQQAEKLSQDLFNSGELDYTSVILAEDTRLNAKQSTILAKKALIDAHIAYLADVVPVW